MTEDQRLAALKSVQAQLQLIDDMSNREGLRDTPRRVVNSWEELYSGYDERPEKLFTVFDSEGYDQIILLKNI